MNIGVTFTCWGETRLQINANGALRLLEGQRQVAKKVNHCRCKLHFLEITSVSFHSVIPSQIVEHFLWYFANWLRANDFYWSFISLFFRVVMFCMLLIISKFSEKTKTDNNLIVLTDIFVPGVWYFLFLCAIKLHCGPKTIKNTSVIHAYTLSDMFFY